MCRDLGEAADVAHQDRLAEGEGRVEHARLLGVAVRQHDQVGAAEQGRDLGVGDEAGHEAHGRGAAAGGRLQLFHVDPERAAHDPQLRPLDPPEGLEQQVDPLVRADQAEEQGNRSLDRGQLRRQRRFLAEAGEVVQRPMRDHVDAIRRDPGLVAQDARPVLGEGDEGVHALQQRAVAGVSSPGLGAKEAVRRLHQRSFARKQPRVEPGDAEPLEMHEVGRLRSGTLEAAHVRQVLDGPQRAPQKSLPARRAPVEAVADLVALGVRHRAVRELRRDQLHVGARARERGAQRSVVRWRVGRGIDDLNPHRQALWGCASPTAS